MAAIMQPRDVSPIGINFVTADGTHNKDHFFPGFLSFLGGGVPGVLGGVIWARDGTGSSI